MCLVVQQLPNLLLFHYITDLEDAVKQIVNIDKTPFSDKKIPRHTGVQRRILVHPIWGKKSLFAKAFKLTVPDDCTIIFAVGRALGADEQQTGVFIQTQLVAQRFERWIQQNFADASKGGGARIHRR